MKSVCKTDLCCQKPLPAPAILPLALRMALQINIFKATTTAGTRKEGAGLGEVPDAALVTGLRVGEALLQVFEVEARVMDKVGRAGICLPTTALVAASWGG